MFTNIFCCSVHFDEMLLSYYTSNNTTIKISVIFPMVYEKINRCICLALRIYCISTECSIFDFRKRIDRPFPSRYTLFKCCVYILHAIMPYLVVAYYNSGGLKNKYETLFHAGNKKIDLSL